jgi:hypothetical protein
VGGTHARALTPTCERCGSEAVRPGTAWARFRHWVDDGADGESAWRCTGCGAAWSDGSGYTVLYAGGQRPAWQVPKALLDAVRRERHWHPVPRFYAGVAAVALVPSALVATVTPVRWGTAVVLGPAAAVAGAFVLSLTSAPGHDVREALARAWAPQDAIRREHEREVVRLRTQVDRFPLLVPETWDGEVVIAGSGWQIPRRGEPELTQVVVVADGGDPADRTSARIEIRLSDDPTDTDELIAEVARSDVEPDRWWDLHALDGFDPEEAHHRLDGALRAAEEAEGHRAEELAGTARRATITVDGLPIEVELVAGRRTQAGVGHLDGRTLHVTGHDAAVEGIALRRVDDATPLLDAYDRRQRTLLGLTDGDQEAT